MEKMKISKYSYSVKDEEGNLLLYNFLTGLSSIKKILKKDIMDYEKIIYKIQEKSEDINISQLGKLLLEIGYFVRYDTDENILLEAKQYGTIYSRRLEVVILPTGNCNFGCPYCFENMKPVPKRFMSIEEQNRVIKYVQKQIPKYTGLHVVWFGGEPLLKPEIVVNLSKAFCSICQARCIPYTSEVITNGYFLDEEMFRTLYGLKTYNFMITLDGLKEQHDSLRMTKNNEGSFDIILKHLLYIRNNIQYKFAHIQIRVNMTKKIVGVLDDLIDFLDVNFGSDHRFSFQFVPVSDFGKKGCSGDENDSNAAMLMPLLFKNEVYLSKLRYSREMLDFIDPTKLCIANLKDSLAILPDLSVCKCHVHYDLPENVLGYIDKEGKFICNHQLHQRWFLPDSGIHNLSEKCDKCFYLPCCHVGGKICPVRKVIDKKEDMSCPFDTPGFLSVIEDAIRYLASISS